MRETTILLVEDEVIVAMSLEQDLKNLGYTVSDIVTSGEEAIEKASELSPDLVLMDIKLDGELDGIQAAKVIRKKTRIPVIYLTAYADADTLQRAKVTEPFGYILKPFEKRSLQSTIEMGLYKSKIETEMCIKNAAIESSINGIALGSLDGNITYVNHSFLSMWNFDNSSKVLGKTVESLWNNEKSSNQFIHALRQRANWAGIAYAQRHDGSSFTVQASFQSVIDASGNILCWMLTCIDITKQMKLEDEAIKTKEYLQSLLDSATELIISIDENTRIATWNKTAERTTGFDKHEIVGRKICHLPVFNDGTEIVNNIKKMNDSEKVECDELLLVTKKGANKLFSVSYSSINTGTKQSGALIIGKDITSESGAHKRIINGRSYLLLKNEPENKAIVSSLLDSEYDLLCFVRPQTCFFDFINTSLSADICLLGDNRTLSDTLIQDADSLINKVSLFCKTRTNPLIILDGLHYFLIQFSFDYVAKLLLRINEIISNSNSIFFVLTDKSLFDKKQVSILKQELHSLPLKDANDIYIDDKVGRVLKFIYDQNQNNASVSFKKVMSEFDIVYATAAKRISALEENQLISIKNSGKAKRMYVSEKGKNFLQNSSCL